MVSSLSLNSINAGPRRRSESTGPTLYLMRYRLNRDFRGIEVSNPQICHAARCRDPLALGPRAWGYPMANPLLAGGHEF